jgi:hypothetical protein
VTCLSLYVLQPEGCKIATALNWKVLLTTKNNVHTVWNQEDSSKGYGLIKDLKEFYQRHGTDCEFIFVVDGARRISD